MLKIVEELEREKADVTDWKRLAVLRGAEWVYSTIRVACEDRDAVGKRLKRLVEELSSHIDEEEALSTQRMKK